VTTKKASRLQSDPRTPSVARRRVTPVARKLETDADIRAGTAALRKLCPNLKRVHGLVGDPPLRRNPGGFPGLAQVVVGQQLSIASARAIWGRTAALVDPFEPATFLAEDVGALRRAGLSGGKVKTLRAVAEAILAGRLSLDAPSSDDQLREEMLAVSGVGPWTADIYVMFCLGHADGFAAGDLALQLAAQRALGLDHRPSARELLEISERWRPWRGVAARLLWAFYVFREPAS
jgi:DNA-3-methyladenine glycosylase II